MLAAMNAHEPSLPKSAPETPSNPGAVPANAPIDVPIDAPADARPKQAHNPLHGVSLKTLLTEIIDYYGFDILFAYLNINCFCKFWYFILTCIFRMKNRLRC